MQVFLKTIVQNMTFGYDLVTSDFLPKIIPTSFSLS